MKRSIGILLCLALLLSFLPVTGVHAVDDSGVPVPTNATVITAEPTKQSEAVAQTQEKAGAEAREIQRRGIVSLISYDGWKPFDAYSACGTPTYPNSGLEYCEGFETATHFRFAYDCAWVRYTVTLPQGFSYSDYAASSADSSGIPTTKRVFNDYYNQKISPAGIDHIFTLGKIYPVYLADAEKDKYYYAKVSISGTAYPDPNNRRNSFEFSETIDVPIFHLVDAWDTATITDSVLGEVSVHWSPSLMNRNYNQETAELSAILSQLAYSEYDLYAFLRMLGFCTIKSENLYTSNLNAVGQYFAEKVVLVGGKSKLFILGIARGTVTNNLEWPGNLYVGSGARHASFANAANQMRENLDSFALRNRIDGLHFYPLKNRFLLLTGHSRGAATVNLLAHNLLNWSSSRYSDYFSEGMVTYTFATPTVTRETQTVANGEAHIYNFVYYQDIIRNAPSMQYYGRWGSTRIFGFETPSGEETTSMTDSLGNTYAVIDGYTGNEIMNSVLYHVDPQSGMVGGMIKALATCLGFGISGQTVDLGAPHGMLNYLNAVRSNAIGADPSLTACRTTRLSQKPR